MDKLALQVGEVDAILKRSGRLNDWQESHSQPKLHSRFIRRLALALKTGSISDNHNRPPLPTKVILLILQFCSSSHPAPHLSRLWDFGNDQRMVYSPTAEPVRTACFVLPKYDRTAHGQISQIQIITDSRDQGWVGDPSRGAWSWFELCILQPQQHEGTGEIRLVQKCAEDGEPLAWISHKNQLAASYVCQRNEGIVFGKSEAVWGWLEDGDYLCVLMCAQFPGWSNHVQGGEIRIWEWFDPSRELEQLYTEGPIVVRGEKLVGGSNGEVAGCDNEETAMAHKEGPPDGGNAEVVSRAGQELGVGKAELKEVGGKPKRSKISKLWKQTRVSFSSFFRTQRE